MRNLFYALRITVWILSLCLIFYLEPENPWAFFTLIFGPLLGVALIIDGEYQHHD